MTKQDISIVVNLVKGRDFDVLRRVAEEMEGEWRGEVATGENEFQYLKSSLERDGKILGVAAYLKRLIEIANDDA